MKFNYGKIFLLGFGFFGTSVIWSVYNAFVPIFLANKFHSLPIVEDGKLTGMITAHDLLEYGFNSPFVTKEEEEEEEIL